MNEFTEFGLNTKKESTTKFYVILKRSILYTLKNSLNYQYRIMVLVESTDKLLTFDKLERVR